MITKTNMSITNIIKRNIISEKRGYERRTSSHHGGANLLSPVQIEKIFGGGVQDRVIRANEGLNTIAKAVEISGHQLERVWCVR